MGKGIASIFSREWVCVGDVDPAGYGARWFRAVSVPSENRFGLWQVIELTNMDEACGRDNEGRSRYVVELSEVCLYEIDPRDGAQCCGLDLTDRDLPAGAIVEACHSYGARAPMGSWEGNNAWALLREARAEANRQDARNGANIYRGMMLARPVNAIGSTAQEYMRGDIYSPIARGVAAGDPKAGLMAKLYGATDDEIAEARIAAAGMDNGGKP